MAVYRKKIELVEAVQWTGDNMAEVSNFVDLSVTFELVEREVQIKQGQVFIYVPKGSYVVKLSNGLYRSYPAYDFERMYELDPEKEVK